MQGRCGSLLLFAFFSAAEIELKVCLPFPAVVASRFVSVSLAFYSPSWGGSLLVRLAAIQLHSPPSACGSAFAHCIRYFAHADVHMRLPSAQPNTSHAACLPPFAQYEIYEFVDSFRPRHFLSYIRGSP